MPDCKHINKNGTCGLKGCYAYRHKCYTEDCCKCFEPQPRAADVETVVHGEWILVGTNEHDYETSVEEKCSLCGRYVYRYDTQPQDNFCPNCGAKMDKEAT